MILLHNIRCSAVLLNAYPSRAGSKSVSATQQHARMHVHLLL